MLRHKTASSGTPKRVMFRLSLPVGAMLAACTPPSQKVAMPDPSANPQNAFDGSGVVRPLGAHSGEPAVKGRDRSDGTPVGQGSVPASMASVKGAGAERLADSPEAASGRRILSAAFVRLGPDGHLTVTLRSGRELVLRDVVMRADAFCGQEVPSGPAGAKYCGDYAQVVAARPGGAPARLEPDSAAPNPIALPAHPDPKR